MGHSHESGIGWRRQEWTIGKLIEPSVDYLDSITWPKFTDSIVKMYGKRAVWDAALFYLQYPANLISCAGEVFHLNKFLAKQKEHNEQKASV